MIARILSVGPLLGVVACSPNNQVPVDSTAAVAARAAPQPVAAATVFVPVQTVPAPMPPTAVPTAVPVGKPVLVSPSDPHLRYVGRFDFQNPEGPAFDWSGTTLVASFTGQDLTILLNDGANSYNLTIDDQSSVLETVPGEQQYVVATGLADGLHTLRLTKRTEAYVGTAVFRGLVLGGGQSLVKGPPPNERRLEFIGDSITAGYGIEGDSPECYFTPATQNAALTYAAQAAYALDADYTLLALSGLGVVRNLHDAEAVSPETAVTYIDRTLAMNSSVRSAPEDWIPDAVIINLGTNDFSSLPFPEDEAFVTAYQDLLAKVGTRYPRAQILALAGPLMLGRAPQLIQQAVARQNAVEKDQRMYYLMIEDNLERSAADFGCDWHPNVRGHQKIAAQLRPELQKIMGW